MNIRVEKSRGIDVHKAFLSATILAKTGIKDTREFSTSLEGLLDLRNWIVENNCQRVSIESTGGQIKPSDIFGKSGNKSNDG